MLVKMPIISHGSAQTHLSSGRMLTTFILN